MMLPAALLRVAGRAGGAAGAAWRCRSSAVIMAPRRCGLLLGLRPAGGAGGAPARGLALVAESESLSLAEAAPRPPPRPAAASLENTYIMGIQPQQLEGQPELVQRVFMLLNGRRKDLTKAQKRAALEQHRRFVDDTGSPEVQAAVLSRGIHAMSAHLSANKKDNNCKRILTRLIHRRRKVLQYLYRLSPKRYHEALEELGLRQTVAPPPEPTYNTKFDVYRIKPGQGTKRQRKKAQKFETKLQKWRDAKSSKRKNQIEATSVSA